MTDITIPPAALEAGARAAMDDAGWHWDSADEARRDIWRRTARAACLAMLEAWPGARERPFWDLMTNARHAEIILPLPQENPDDKA